MIRELDTVETVDGFQGEVISRNYDTVIVYNAEKDVEKKVKIWNVKKK